MILPPITPCLTLIKFTKQSGIRSCIRYYLNFAWIELTEPEGTRYEVVGLHTAELVQRRYKVSSMKLYLSTANA